MERHRRMSTSQGPHGNSRARSAPPSNRNRRDKVAAAPVARPPHLLSGTPGKQL
jgi:hypothetical protein